VSRLQFTFTCNHTDIWLLDEHFRTFFEEKVKPQLSLESHELQTVRIYLYLKARNRLPLLSSYCLNPYKSVPVQRAVYASTGECAYIEMDLSGPFTLSGLM